MPGFPPLPPEPGGIPRATEHVAKIGFVDFTGNRKNARLVFNDKEDLTEAEVLSWAAAMGNASNAGVYRIDWVGTTSIARAKAFTYDEAYSTVQTLAVFKFQNALNEVARVELPAPDASILTPDYMKVDVNQAEAAALITETLYILNERGLNDNTYVLVDTQVVHRSLRGAGTRVVPESFTEPGIADLPGSPPGEIPV